MHNNEKKISFVSCIRTVGTFLPVLFWGGLILGFEGAYMAFTTVICALIHEIGHIMYLVFSAHSGHSIKSVIFGLKIKAVKLLSYKDELFVYVFGPLFNLIFGAVFLLLSMGENEFLYSLALINFATAFSNLLPIEGYDGYGILRVLIEQRTADGRFLNVLSNFSALLVFTLCILSIYLIDRYGGGYWIFAVFFVQMIKQFKKSLG